MTSIVSYDRELAVAFELARKAGSLILKHYDGPIVVERKIDADDYVEPVTVVDREANELIVDGIHSSFPHDGVLAEESIDTAGRLTKQRVWMVDPLDGTNGFISRDGDFAVQIGLTVDGQGVLGVVFQPLTGVMYYATQGKGAWIDRAGTRLERALVSTELDLTKMRLAASRSHRSPRMNRVVEVLGTREEVNRGSVGVKIGLLIERLCDLYVHLSPRTKQWDTCAPEVILREAGGEMTDLFGRELMYNSADVQNRNGVVASNGAAHEQVIARLAPLLTEFGRLPV